MAVDIGTLAEEAFWNVGGMALEAGQQTLMGQLGFLGSTVKNFANTKILGSVDSFFSSTKNPSPEEQPSLDLKQQASELGFFALQSLYFSGTSLLTSFGTKLLFHHKSFAIVTAKLFKSYAPLLVPQIASMATNPLWQGVLQLLTGQGLHLPGWEQLTMGSVTSFGGLALEMISNNSVKKTFRNNIANIFFKSWKIPVKKGKLCPLSEVDTYRHLADPTPVKAVKKFLEAEKTGPGPVSFQISFARYTDRTTNPTPNAGPRLGSFAIRPFGSHTSNHYIGINIQADPKRPLNLQVVSIQHGKSMGDWDSKVAVGLNNEYWYEGGVDKHSPCHQGILSTQLDHLLFRQKLDLGFVSATGWGPVAIARLKSTIDDPLFLDSLTDLHLFRHYPDSEMTLTLSGYSDGRVATLVGFSWGKTAATPNQGKTSFNLVLTLKRKRGNKWVHTIAEDPQGLLKVSTQGRPSTQDVKNIFLASLERLHGTRKPPLAEALVINATDSDRSYTLTPTGFAKLHTGGVTDQDLPIERITRALYYSLLREGHESEAAQLRNVVNSYIGISTKGRSGKPSLGLDLAWDHSFEALERIAQTQPPDERKTFLTTWYRAFNPDHPEGPRDGQVIYIVGASHSAGNWSSEHIPNGFLGMIDENAKTKLFASGRTNIPALEIIYKPDRAHPWVLVRATGTGVKGYAKAFKENEWMVEDAEITASTNYGPKKGSKRVVKDKKETNEPPQPPPNTVVVHGTAIDPLVSRKPAPVPDTEAELPVLLKEEFTREPQVSTRPAPTDDHRDVVELEAPSQALPPTPPPAPSVQKTSLPRPPANLPPGGSMLIIGSEPKWTSYASTNRTNGTRHLKNEMGPDFIEGVKVVNINGNIYAVPLMQGDKASITRAFQLGLDGGVFLDGREMLACWTQSGLLTQVLEHNPTMACFQQNARTLLGEHPRIVLTPGREGLTYLGQQVFPGSLGTTRMAGRPRANQYLLSNGFSLHPINTQNVSGYPHVVMESLDGQIVLAQMQPSDTYSKELASRLLADGWVTNLERQIPKSTAKIGRPSKDK